MSDSPPQDHAQARVRTGVAGLDTILGGGFMQGGIYIVQGSPGVGKTIFSNQFCFQEVASGGRALFVTLLAENHARMVANLRGLSFFDEGRIPDQLTYLSAYRELHDAGLKGLVDLLRREIQRKRCTVLVLDGIVSAQSSSASDQLFREFIHDLQEIALATDCTILLNASVNSGTVSPEETMVDGLIEFTDRNYGWRAESDLQVKKLRGAPFLRGRHAYEITNDGVVVHPRIEGLYARPSIHDEGSLSRTSSGSAQLDAMLKGGLPTASTTMVMGPSGAGKTTMGLHFLSRSSATEPGLMFSFYETPVRLVAKAHGVCRALPALIDSGDVEILWQPPTDGQLDAYGERLLDAVKRRGVKRLFIDGLTSFRQAAVEPSRLDHFFAALANELRVLGVTTLYTLEVPDILGPAIRVPVDDVSSLAENLILLRFIELRSQLHRMVSILKVRDSDFDPSLHQYTLTSSGMDIRASSETAEAILADLNLDAQRPVGARHAGQAETLANKREG
jgi:circadian clock protein KaiC